MQAEIWTLLEGPTYLSPDLETWYYPYDDWASKAYIVCVDLIQDTLIPEHMAAASLVRGAKQPSLKK